MERNDTLCENLKQVNFLRMLKAENDVKLCRLIEIPTDVVVNFLSQLIFSFPLLLWMEMNVK